MANQICCLILDFGATSSYILVRTKQHGKCPLVVRISLQLHDEFKPVCNRKLWVNTTIKVVLKVKPFVEIAVILHPAGLKFGVGLMSFSGTFGQVGSCRFFAESWTCLPVIMTSLWREFVHKGELKFSTHHRPCNSTIWYVKILLCQWRVYDDWRFHSNRLLRGVLTIFAFFQSFIEFFPFVWKEKIILYFSCLFSLSRFLRTNFLNLF